MSSETGKGKPFRFHVVSFIAHAILAALAVVAPMPEKTAEPIAITLAELVLAPEPEPEPVVEPPPPEAEPEPAPPEPKPAPEPPPPPKPAPKPEPPPPQPAAEAPPPDTGSEEPAFADLGLVMGGGGPGGVAVAAGRAPTRQAAARQNTATQATPAKAAAPKCTEEPTKAKPKKIVPPSYTAEAQQAEIEGPVRLEIVIDEKGSITSAKVLRGLGYGLDEAAIAAAKNMVFEPSRRCGVAVASTLTFNMRFTLGS